jgi:hypothetical protein
MSSMWVFGAYALAVSVPLVLLHFFRAGAWYWHALSIGAGLALGLTPMPVEWSSPQTDLMIGFAFVVLIVWGLAAPFFRAHEAMHPRAG